MHFLQVHGGGVSIFTFRDHHLFNLFYNFFLIYLGNDGMAVWRGRLEGVGRGWEKEGGVGVGEEEKERGVGVGVGGGGVSRRGRRHDKN